MFGFIIPMIKKSDGTRLGGRPPLLRLVMARIFAWSLCKAAISMEGRVKETGVHTRPAEISLHPCRDQTCLGRIRQQCKFSRIKVEVTLRDTMKMMTRMMAT